MKSALGIDVEGTRTSRARTGIQIGKHRGTPEPVAGTPHIPAKPETQEADNPNAYGGSSYTNTPYTTNPAETTAYVNSTGMTPQSPTNYVGASEVFGKQPSAEPGKALQQTREGELPQTMADADRKIEQQMAEEAKKAKESTPRQMSDAEQQAMFEKQLQHEQLVDRAVKDMGEERAKWEAGAQARMDKQVKDLTSDKSAPRISADGKYEYTYEPVDDDEEENGENKKADGDDEGSMVGYLPDGGATSPANYQQGMTLSGSEAKGGNDAPAVQYQDSMDLSSSPPKLPAEQAVPKVPTEAKEAPPPSMATGADHPAGQAPPPPKGPGPTSSSIPVKGSGDEAHADMSEAAKRLADYAAMQVAALTQWEKADLLGVHKKAVVAGKAAWQQARQAFRALAKGDPSAAVPDLTTLYVTPPDSPTLKKQNLAPVALDQSMVDLARSLPGKVQRFHAIAEAGAQQENQNSEQLEKIVKTAKDLKAYADAQIKILEDAEQAALPDFLRKSVVAGKAGWEGARDAYAAVADGNLSVPPPEMDTLFVTPEKSASYNKFKLKHVVLDAKKVDLARLLHEQVRSLRG